MAVISLVFLQGNNKKVCFMGLKKVIPPENRNQGNILFWDIYMSTSAAEEVI